MLDGITTVWLDNPPVNAISTEVAHAVSAQLEALPEGTRVVVLRGRGEKAFSAGADISSVAVVDGSAPAWIQPLCDQIEALPVPVVAAIHGHCLGGGLEIALACDVRIAHAGAGFALPEIKLGIIPGGGGTQRLPRLIGPARARWMMLSGERIDVARAEAWGLLTHVLDDLEAGIVQVAGVLAAQSPHAVAALKKLLRETADARSDQAEIDTFIACAGSEDGKEGIAAFLAKRAPVWTGR